MKKSLLLFVALLATSAVSLAQDTYFIKHPWGGGEWTWKQMQLSDDPDLAAYDMDGNVIDHSYIVEGIYGGDGCNINTTASDEGSKWIAEPFSRFELEVGENCVFIYYPHKNDLSILPEFAAKVRLNLDHPMGTYDGSQNIHASITGAEEVLSIDYMIYTENDPDFTHYPYDDNVGINITETCELSVHAEYIYDGKVRENGWVYPYVINQTSTGVNDLNVTVTSKAVKTIENGQLVITKDGKRYNVAGQLMK